MSLSNYKKKKVTKEAKIGFYTVNYLFCCIVITIYVPQVPAMALLSNLGVGGMSCLGLVILAVISFKGEPLIQLGKNMDQICRLAINLVVICYFPNRRGNACGGCPYYASGYRDRITCSI